MRLRHWLASASIIIATSSSASAQRPTLVVFVAIDQMRTDYLSTWSPQLTGGLMRFWTQGAFFTNAFQDHANTETAPGHASMLSGRFPYSTGITANSVGVNTPDARLIESPDTGASPFRFRGTTLADWMKAKDPRTRVLSVSRKDRSAILPVASSHDHTVLWYSPKTARFTTSSWYATALPEWVRAFNAQRPVLSLAGATWDLLLPVSAYPEADSSAAERVSNAMFPHVLSMDSARVGSGIVDTPWMDSLTLVLALRGVRAMELGAAANRVDLLSVSLSSTDAIGHRWGPDSRELHDQVLRVDRYLGAFLDSLYAIRGRDRVVVALTSDHGVTPIPEIVSRFRQDSAKRVMSAAYRPALAAARATLRAAGADTTALRWEDLTLYLDRNKLKGIVIDTAALSSTFMTTVRAIPGVLRVETLPELAMADTSRDAIARRWLRMFRPGVDPFPGMSVLAIATLQPFYYAGSSMQSTHGSPHDSDANVPVAFLGAPFAQGRFASKVNVVDIAPTLAALLGVPPLERLDGRVLKEALR
jgi:predicted AlkP superfamily pyrophosphatase or phosphodiesterase